MINSGVPINRHNLTWPDNTDRASIERYMIQQGGEWEKDGVKFGNGLIFHFNEYWKLLWPQDDQTWWTDLIMKTVLENQFTSVAGGASAWKSGTIGRLALMDWSCFPDCTTIIISSTNMEGLKARIFAEIIMLWKIASSRYAWFPGHPVDYKCAIVADDVEEVEARDMRNAIIGVPCFLAGTLIDTPEGKMPIEEIKVGQKVFNALGVGTVKETHENFSDKIFRVTLNDGRYVDCTSEHPFLTQRGWINAVDLLTYDTVLSVHETLQIMQQGNAEWVSEPKILQPALQAFSSANKLPSMREAVSSVESKPKMEGKKHGKVLFPNLRLCVDSSKQALRVNQKRTMQTLQKENGKCSSPENFLLCKMPQQDGNKPMQTMRKKVCFNPRITSEETLSFLRSVLQIESDWTHQCSTAYKANEGRTCCLENISRINPSFSHSNRIKDHNRKKALVSIGRGFSRYKAGGRNRRWYSRDAGSIASGHNQDKNIGRSWVASVKVLELAGKSGIGKSGQKHKVFNLSVTGHPSYSANGIIVHNCKTSSGKFIGMGSYAGRKNRRVWCIGDEFQFMELSILDGQRNLVSNGSNLVPGVIREKSDREFGLPRRGYKGVFIANPNPSRPGNPADIISEPENGWGSIPEDGKTKVWKCKQMPDHPVKCTCICLDSLDSPNNDYPIDKPRWDNLAGKHKLKLYAEGSESYWSQGRGIFKFGLAQFKIITREICEQFHALESPIWKGTPTVKIGMLDAAYGAGDRCALGWLEFGKCSDEKVRIAFKQHWLVPIVIRKDLTAENQIAIFCKEKMELAGVPPENFFFDGRGSMAMSLASQWSANVNAIEFGGVPSDRPAGPDIWTVDKLTGRRRLKTEREHYSKNVSALWWAWRYVIDADQMRGLIGEIISDAMPREWYKVGGDRIEIETNAEMMVSGIEGARRRGFQISTLQSENNSSPDNGRWLADLSKKRFNWHKSKMVSVR
jgi:hypothetical protein